MTYYAYQRSSFGGRLTPAVKSLLIACGIAFVLQQLTGQKMLYIFGLVPVIFWKDFFLWQLVSYIFLHGDIFHLLFNLLALYMFGCGLEKVWGSRFFLRYFFVTGIGAGLTSVCLTPSVALPTIGASGAIFGILLAYALYYPNQIVYFNFLFPIRMKYLVLIYGLLTFYFSLSGTGGNVAYLAHLGGMFFGLLYLRPGFLRTIYTRVSYKIKLWWFRRRFRIVDGTRKRGDNDRTYH